MELALSLGDPSKQPFSNHHMEDPHKAAAVAAMNMMSSAREKDLLGFSCMGLAPAGHHQIDGHQRSAPDPSPPIQLDLFTLSPRVNDDNQPPKQQQPQQQQKQQIPSSSSSHHTRHRHRLPWFSVSDHSMSDPGVSNSDEAEGADRNRMPAATDDSPNSNSTASSFRIEFSSNFNRGSDGSGGGRRKRDHNNLSLMSSEAAGGGNIIIPTENDNDSYNYCYDEAARGTDTHTHTHTNTNAIERLGCNYSRVSDDEDNALTRKKLRLSKEQSAFLEESFKEHHTLNPKQKHALAKQLNLRPRQVEVWFQNRRARTKLKQTEVDCEYLKRCCEALTEENKRLQKEVQELRALKASHPFYTHVPATTLTMCPSCERVATATAVSKPQIYAAAPQHPHPPAASAS